MIELQHVLPEPEELSDYRRRNPGGHWGIPAFEPVRSILRGRLNDQQDGLCVYCEQKLAEDSGHVEHIKPRSSYPNLAFVYDNLAHSCDGPGHCGHHKRDRVLPIEPRPGCNRFFVLSFLDGRLSPRDGLLANEAQDAEATVAVLGLNTPSLAWQRKGYADAILALSSAAEVAEFMQDIPFRALLQGI